jgi:uncharacterized membrane protein YeaQ/YmgE (transglycosylase-associated protein family)
MGVFVWIAVGLISALLLRLALRLSHHAGWKPNLGLAVLGAVLGGFAIDLTVRGDSVVHFRGPSFAGAVIGTVVILAISFAIVWVGNLRTHDVRHT